MKKKRTKVFVFPVDSGEYRFGIHEAPHGDEIELVFHNTKNEQEARRRLRDLLTWLKAEGGDL